MAEDHRPPHLEKSEHIDDGVLDLARRNPNRAILDIPVGLALVDRVDSEGISLEAPGQRRDIPGNRCREKQRAALRRRRIENELQILTEA
jgi:hypothetical protein